MLSLAPGQPRSVRLAGHRHVGLVFGPWPRVDDLSLGADVDALTGPPRRAGLPEPSPAQLVLAELLACAQVGQPPSAREERAGRRAGGQRREDE